MTYYAYSYCLNNADAYILWYTDDSSDSNEADGIVLDDTGHLPTFADLADLRAYADRRSLAVEPEVNAEPLDLDAVRRWLGAARKTNVDCEAFLEAWNLFSDLASTIKGKEVHIDDQKESHIYNKLFWGNNFPALTPPGKFYEPIWSKSEVSRMWNVLDKGMQMFQSRLVEQPSDMLPVK